MKVIRHALAKFGFRPPGSQHYRPNYQQLMHDALQRVRIAEIGIQEARSLEELDTSRSAMAAAWAEVQQVVRLAKRDRGIALRPIAETEELHRNLRDLLNHRIGEHALSRKSTTYR